ncbi:hypothetical protein [Bacillus sp. JJ722]|uniref:hypothetical protein n=1 Tax=Bacillus sp. JJ722 TaxID=3122973 RepID=UPI0030006976
MRNNVMQFQHRKDIDHFLLMQGKNILDNAFKRIKDSLIIMQVEEERRFRYVYANQNAFNPGWITEGSIGKLIEDVHNECIAIAMKRQFQLVMGFETEQVTRLSLNNMFMKDCVSDIFLMPVKNEDKHML